MFCRKCGYELPSDADFCPKCGTKVEVQELVVQENNDEIQNQNRAFGERDKSASVQEVMQFGVTQNTFASRIESSSDRETNDALFSLYEKLIEPVKHIEQLAQKIRGNKSTIEDKRIYKLKKINVGGYIKFAFLIDIIPLFLVNAFTIRHNKVEISKSSANLTIISITVIFVILCMLFEKFSNKLSANKRYKRELKEADELEIKTTRLEEELDMMINQFKPAIAYVNISYRTSEALSFFVHGYKNADFCTLQEAQREYREELKHKEEMYKMDSIMNELANIQMLQVETADILYKIDKSIKWHTMEVVYY